MKLPDPMLVPKNLDRFQLEHARDIAHRHSGDDLQFEPRLVALLATAYEKSGKSLRAFALRLDFAEEYLTQRKEKDAAEVLTPIDSGKLPAAATATCLSPKVPAPWRTGQPSPRELWRCWEGIVFGAGLLMA